MERLLDQSRVYAAQDFKYKVDLMYRSSQTNEDRSGVLMYNNPMPNLNNQEGEESVIRYMPSWLGDAEVSHTHSTHIQALFIVTKLVN